MADFYRAEKVNDRITAIISFTGEIMYLVNGSERSLLIDTCVGAGNLRDFVERLTEKPLTVLLTHIKAFEQTAKKYGIDFALKKDSTETPPRYLVFFKGRDADALTAAFKEFSAKKLTQEQKPSIRKALATFREAAKQLNANRQKTKHKDREVSL